MTRSVSWPRVGVQTARHLQHKHRRLDRRTLSAEVVVNRMYEGACLHLYHDRRRGPVWRLSVMPLPKCPTPSHDWLSNATDIVPVGDTLFPDDCLSQTYRYLARPSGETE